MNIRWRLSIFVIQMSILLGFSYIVTGELISGNTWFVAGIFSVVINPQLLEPFYAKPADVVGNCILSLLLYFTTQKYQVSVGWDFFAILLGILIIIALIAIIFGSGKKNASRSTIGKIAMIISGEATSVRIYSIVFWLSLLDLFSLSSIDLWLLATGWLIIVTIGLINWERIWEEISRHRKHLEIEGMIGPNRLLVSSKFLSRPGSIIKIQTNSGITQGILIRRIKRMDDVWGEILISSQEECESLLNKTNISIGPSEEIKESVFGTVEVGSSDSRIFFSPLKNLKLNDVVAVFNDDNKEILFQISEAFIKEQNIKNGSQLSILAIGNQIGSFNFETLKLKRHDWVVNPGTMVGKPSFDSVKIEGKIPERWVEIGNIGNSTLPFFVNLDALLEGHLAILGMTKMGKSTFAHKIAKKLANFCWVTVLDQTGEYKSKLSVPLHTQNRDKNSPSLAVFEPTTGSVPPDVALQCIEKIVTSAREEYDNDQLFNRVFIIDEAHQFIPEPAVIGYRGPGRDSSLKIGALMMQIRKYGISMILISQRTAVIAKSALSQCENLIVFRSVDQTGLNYIESIIGNEATSFIPRLEQGQALCFGPAFSSNTPVVVQLHHNIDDNK